MSRVSRCIDSGPMEAFREMLKTEMYYLRTFPSYEELKQAVIDYIGIITARDIKNGLIA